MASDVRILTPSGWESIKGPKGDTGAAGPAGPSVVSTDAGQLAKLGTDSKVLVASADLDARYVNQTGDTVTGPLSVSYAAARFLVTGAGAIVSSIYSTDGSAANLNVSSGSNTGQFLQNGTLCVITNFATAGVLRFAQTGAGLTQFFVNAVKVMELSGSGATVAGTLTATGNISSDGTAHTFKAGSIQAAAIAGLDTVATGGLKPATASVLGGVKVGGGLAVDAGGTLSATVQQGYTLPVATASELGGIKVGSGLSIDAGGVLTAPPAIAASAVAGAALAASGAVGTSAAYARADHTHPFPTAANVGALALTGGTVTGLVTINYAAAQLIVGGTGNTTTTIRSTDGGNSTLNLSSGTNTGQFNQNGINFTFTNYATAGTIRFNQNGAGLTQFFVGGIKVLELSSTVGGTFQVGLTTPALTLSTKRTPASQTAAGVAGQVEWDADYLYLAIAANQWRRIPFTDWHGNTLPGSGAGATDTALPADFIQRPQGVPDIGATVSIPSYAGTIANNGKIMMSMGGTVPPLATGIKVQFRIHGGNWQDATNASYWTRTKAAGLDLVYEQKADFAAIKLVGLAERIVVISGPAPGSPYITRMAWVSDLGTGVWSGEYTAVTPTG